MEVLASRHGSVQAPVEALYRRYSRDVLTLAYRTVGSRGDAEDVAQTTFLNAHRALLGGVRPANERAWLLAIARNVCRHRFRALAQRPREEPLDETRLPPRNGSADEEPSLVDALDALLPRQRQALVLQAIHGCSTTEIGERLGLGASAVDALLFRARSALRDELETTAELVDCARTERFVERQLADELGEREQTALRAHLRACSSCARQARSVRARKRIRSLLVMPWDLLSRLLGPVGSGGVGVKAATVLALALGAAAADRAVQSGSDREPPARALHAAVTQTQTQTPDAARLPGVPRARPAPAEPASPARPTQPPRSVPPPTQRDAEVVVPAQPVPEPPSGSSTPAPQARPVAMPQSILPELPVSSPPLETVDDVLETVTAVLETATDVLKTANVPEITVPEVPDVPEAQGTSVGLPREVATATALPAQVAGLVRVGG